MYFTTTFYLFFDASGAYGIRKGKTKILGMFRVFRGPIKMSELIYRDESYAIVGACFNVYKEMGCGFLEAVYQECLEIEFEYQNVPFEAQKELRLAYRQRRLKKTFIPDFVCYDKIIVEIKAVSRLTDEHRSQVQNYLNATDYKLGLLVNFGHYPKVEYERFVLDKKRHRR